MTQGYLNPYVVDEFQFLGCHVFTEGDSNFLLSRNGYAMFVDDALLDSIRLGKMPEGLKIKLV